MGHDLSCQRRAMRHHKVNPNEQWQDSGEYEDRPDYLQLLIDSSVKDESGSEDGPGSGESGTERE